MIPFPILAYYSLYSAIFIIEFATSKHYTEAKGKNEKNCANFSPNLGLGLFLRIPGLKMDSIFNFLCLSYCTASPFTLINMNIDEASSRPDDTNK